MANCIYLHDSCIIKFDFKNDFANLLCLQLCMDLNKALDTTTWDETKKLGSALE